MNERIKQMLACQFTEEEKVAMAQEMAQATCKKTALEKLVKEYCK